MKNILFWCLVIISLFFVGCAEKPTEQKTAKRPTPMAERPEAVNVSDLPTDGSTWYIQQSSIYGFFHEDDALFTPKTAYICSDATAQRDRPTEKVYWVVSRFDANMLRITNPKDTYQTFIISIRNC